MRGTPQTDYPVNLDPYADGMIQDNRTRVVEDHVALETILFGLGVTSGANAGDTPGLSPNEPVLVPKRNVAAAVFSGDLVTSNVVNGTLNGVAISPVTFASSNALTMAALGVAGVAALATLGITATYALSNSNNTVTWTAANSTVLLASFVVTAGGGQATVTYTYTTSYVFRGVASWVQKQLVSSGVAGYAATEVVGVCRRGLVAVRAKGAVAADAAIYCDLADLGYEGRFTSTSTGNLATGGIARSAAADGELFLLELNLP